MKDPRYHTQRWRDLAEWCKRRDGYRCTAPGCNRKGRGRKGLIADHIIEVEDGGAFWDPRNVQTLCWDHHASKTWQNKAEKVRSPNG